MSKSAMEVYRDGRVAESDMEDCIHDFGVCSDWTFDDYDRSVEMLGTQDGWLPSAEQRAAMLALGIHQAFISYMDGSAVLVSNATGAAGGCSPRSSPDNTSALVSGLRHAVAAAEAAVAVRDALLREVCAAVETRKGSTCDVPWSLVARIDTTLRGDASAKEAHRGD